LFLAHGESWLAMEMCAMPTTSTVLVVNCTKSLPHLARLIETGKKWRPPGRVQKDDLGEKRKLSKENKEK
jgi:hypothetical protein